MCVGICVLAIRSMHIYPPVFDQMKGQHPRQNHRKPELLSQKLIAHARTCACVREYLE